MRIIGLLYSILPISKIPEMYVTLKDLPCQTYFFGGDINK